MGRRPTNTDENQPNASSPQTERVRMAPLGPPELMKMHPVLAESANEESPDGPVGATKVDENTTLTRGVRERRERVTGVFFDRAGSRLFFA
jgi:hypothetical protein